MPLFTKDGRSVLFVHVPKTGGTTVEHAFRQAGWRMHLYADPTPEYEFEWDLAPHRRSSPQHFHAAILRETLYLDTVDAVFMVVRDPIARFRSEYAMHARSRDLGSAAAVERWAIDALTEYGRNPYHLDNHLRPQVQFALDEGDIYRFEEGLGTILADLDDRLSLGLPSDVGHLLDSARGGGLRSSDVELSDRVLDLLQAFYADDFRLLGYPSPASRLVHAG